MTDSFECIVHMCLSCIHVKHWATELLIKEKRKTLKGGDSLAGVCVKKSDSLLFFFFFFDVDHIYSLY